MKNIEELNYVFLKEKALKKMQMINDQEHSIEHIEDVVYFMDILIKKLKNKLVFNENICYLIAYWHDVGRQIKDEGHERISAEMLKKEMNELNFRNEFIDTVYNSIVNHKWNMQPNTIEGKILKDADKLAWIGKNRWKKCLQEKKNISHVIELLPKLRNEILIFEESKVIYDETIVKLVSQLYNECK